MNHADERFYRVVAVAEPKLRDELAFVLVTLENMKGEQKEERITFPDMFVAWDFYRTQKNMLLKGKGNGRNNI